MGADEIEHGGQTEPEPEDARVARMGALDVTPRQILDCYDRVSVEAMARGRGLTVSRGVSKEHILGHLEPVLLAADNLRETVADLSARELAVLRFAKESGGRTTAAAILQQMWARQVAKPEEAIRTLVRRGLLLYPYEPERAAGTGRYGKLKGHHRFWCPAQVLAAVELPPVELPSETLTRTPPADNVVPAGEGFLADLYQAWRYLDDTLVAPLRGGGVGRRHRRKLRERLSPVGVADEVELGAEDRVDFLYHLLGAVGAVAEVEERLTPTTLADAFFDRPNADLLQELVAAWAALEAWNEFRRIPELVLLPGDLRGNADVPTSHTLARGRRLLLEELRRVPVGEWVSLARFTAFVRARHLELILPRDREVATHYRGIAEAGNSLERKLRMPDDWDRVEGRFVRQVVAESLHWMGLVDLGMSRSARDAGATCTAFRLTPRGAAALPGSPAASEPEPEMKLVVQPSFDLIAMNACENIAALRRVDRFAELTKVDKACSLRLTPESVRRGLKAGLSTETMQQLLERYADAPLPQNVTYSLQDWAQAFEMIKLLPEATLLEVTEGALLDELSDSPRWGRALLRRLTPTLALVDSARADDLQVLLQRRGVVCSELMYGRPPTDELDLTGTEVHVPEAALQPYTEYFLGRVADRPETRDGKTVYRLTPRSVRQAVAQGLTLKELATFLRTGARQPVPTELLVTLKAWAGKYPPVRLEPMVVFSTSDATTMNELLKVPAIDELVVDRVGVDQALVEPADVAKLRELLAELELDVGTHEE